MSVLLVPLLNVSDKLLEDLKEELGNSLLSKIIVAQPQQSLPEKAYDKQREQYNAARLVSDLNKQYLDYDANKVLAIGNMDLFVDELNFVFGVAQKGGRFCMVSLYRLDPRFYGKESTYEKLKERAVKECIHEIGHCCGLDHCKTKKCVMGFSNDIMSVDLKEKNFCEECREKVRHGL
jgi:archaemetzincin